MVDGPVAGQQAGLQRGIDERLETESAARSGDGCRCGRCGRMAGPRVSVREAESSGHTGQQRSGGQQHSVGEAL